MKNKHIQILTSRPYNIQYNIIQYSNLAYSLVIAEALLLNVEKKTLYLLEVTLEVTPTILVMQK